MNRLHHSLTLLLLSLITSAAWAESPAETELRSAQLAYQKALSERDSYTNQIPQLEQDLQTAKNQEAEAQRRISELQGRLQASTAAKAQADAALAAAGQRLEAAWSAVRGH